MVFHLNKLESPSPKKGFVPNLVEIGRVVLGKKLKIGKVYRQTDDGRRRSEKLTSPLSSGELKTLLNFNKGEWSKIFFGSFFLEVIKEKGKIMY